MVWIWTYLKELFNAREVARVNLHALLINLKTLNCLSLDEDDTNE